MKITVMLKLKKIFIRKMIEKINVMSLRFRTTTCQCQRLQELINSQLSEEGVKQA